MFGSKKFEDKCVEKKIEKKKQKKVLKSINYFYILL